MRPLLICLGFLLCMSVQGQDISIDGIELLHRARKVTRVIPIGEKIILRTETERVRGELEGVDSEHVTVDGKAYPIRDLIWISQRTFTSYLLATGLAILGLGMTGSGVVYITESERGGFINGGLITMAGVGITTLSYASFRNGRRIYLDSEWKLIPPNG